MESPDQLKNWAQRHRKAFDTLEPPADLWTAIERQLDADEVIQAAVATPMAAAPPKLTATRGGQFAMRGWWQMAAAAIIVFTCGYGLRMQTETAAPAVAINDVPATTITAQPADETPAAPSQRSMVVNGFRNEEPDPAMQATLLTSSTHAEVETRPTTASPADADRELTQRLRRLEARYEALVAYHQPQTSRGRFTSSRPLADEWDHEMAALDSGYAVLRLELTRNPNTDEVVEAMTRNLHMRLALLNQQVRALDVMQQSRHRTTRPQPRRPPSVNPDVPTPTEDAPGGGWHSPARAPSPAPMLDAATRPQPQFDSSSRNAQIPNVVRAGRIMLVAA